MRANRDSCKDRACRKSRGQSLVEFALISPIIIMLAFIAADIGRLVYIYGAITAAAQAGARTAAVQANATSDCPTIASIKQLSNGVNMQMDPNSTFGNSNPTNPSGLKQPSTSIPADTAYWYIWPAVATSSSDCTGPQRNTSSSTEVVVEIQYSFQPITPFVSQLVPPFTIVVSSTQPVI